MGDLSNYAFNPYAVPTGLVGLGVLILGLAVLHRGRASLTSRLFFNVALASSTWLFAFTGMYCAVDPRVAHLWAKLAYFGVPLIPVTSFHFSVGVLKLHEKERNAVWAFWAISAALTAVILTSDALVTRVHRYWWGYYPIYGRLSIPFLIAFFGIMGTSLRLYIKAYRQAKPASAYRRRAGTFLLAFSVLNLGGVDYFAKFGIPVYPIGYLPVLMFLIVFIRTIWRHDLMDLTPTFAAEDVLKRMGEALLVLDPDGMIRVANPVACALLKTSEMQLIGTPLAEVDSRFVSPETMASIMNGESVERATVRIRERTSLRTYDVSASALQGSAHTPVGVICTIKDVTERKLIERALQISESRFARLAQSNIIGIIVVDLHGRVLEANDAFLNMMGYSPSDLSEKRIRWDRMTPPEQVDLNRQAVQEVRKSGTATTREREYFRKDGSRISVVVGAALMDGYKDRCICFVLDNTRRKVAEHKLLILNETLEQRVAERSAAAERRARELVKTNQELDEVTKELRDANTRLEELSLLDPLTELLNRRGLQQALAQEIQRMRRESSQLAALLVDLDDFKRINDQLGYAVGDVVVKEVAKKLKLSLRVTDHVARIGGDEFLILLPGLNIAESMHVAEKVLLSISGAPLFMATGSTVKVTASLGLVMVSGETPCMDTLVSEAHIALRRSKQQGKNRVSAHQAVGQQEPAHAASLSEIMRVIHDGDKLRIVAQPIVRLEDNQIMGFEFLSRFPASPFEMPEDVFRLCLEANVLTTVDHQCFKSCMCASEGLPKTVRRHINLFPSTIANIAVEELLRLIPEGSEPGQYCIELSEQQILGESAPLAGSIEALKRSGVLIAIDDVGFGRSSLESLLLFEPNLIKIDKRCIRGVAHDPIRVRSLKRLLNVAAALGTEVIAEGIENEQDLAVLKTLKVAYGQGFFLGRPSSLESLKAFRGRKAAFHGGLENGRAVKPHAAIP